MDWQTRLKHAIFSISRCASGPRQNLGVAISSATFLALATLVVQGGFSSEAGFAQAGADLPQGHYIYLGSEPGKTPQRTFTIDSQGAIHWDNQTNGQAASKNGNKGGGWLNKIVGQDDENGDWERHEYPFIKWKAQRVDSTNEGIAALSTTAMPGKTKGRVIVKYNVLVDKIAGPSDLQIEFRDRNSFGLFQATVPGASFRPIPESTQYETTGQWPSVSEDDYKKARQLVIH